MSPSTTDLSGTTLGEYELISRIGRGGMGVVYEGLHPVIGKKVAVKVLAVDAVHQQEALERFLSEARAVNAIRHRGIVDIFGFGKLPDGSQYFVMELLEGHPFDELIRTRAPISVPDALRWVDETLDALDAAHHAGVIHRDIKPSNLFLVDTGRGQPYVKLLDFGIAWLSSVQGGPAPQTALNAVIGPPDDMAPEQARAKPISGQTDIYALGCVLFEMITGQRIFSGSTPLEVMSAHAEQRPRLPSSLNHAIPPQVDELVLRMVAKHVDDRPKSARVAREELHAVLAALGEAPSLSFPIISRSQLPAAVLTQRTGSGYEPTTRTASSALSQPGPRGMALPALIGAGVLLAAGVGFYLWPQPPPLIPQTQPISPPVVLALDASVAVPQAPVAAGAVEALAAPPAQMIDGGTAAAVVPETSGPKKATGPAAF